MQFHRLNSGLPAPADTRLHYTPLLRHPEHPHYYIVQLQRLAMGGQDLPVDEVTRPYSCATLNR